MLETIKALSMEQIAIIIGGIFLSIYFLKKMKKGIRRKFRRFKNKIVRKGKKAIKFIILKFLV